MGEKTGSDTVGERTLSDIIDDIEQNSGTVEQTRAVHELIENHPAVAAERSYDDPDEGRTLNLAQYLLVTDHDPESIKNGIELRRQYGFETPIRFLFKFIDQSIVSNDELARGLADKINDGEKLSRILKPLVNNDNVEALLAAADKLQPPKKHLLHMIERLISRSGSNGLKFFAHLTSPNGLGVDFTSENRQQLLEKITSGKALGHRGSEEGLQEFVQELITRGVDDEQKAFVLAIDDLATRQPNFAIIDALIEAGVELPDKNAALELSGHEPGNRHYSSFEFSYDVTRAHLSDEQSVDDVQKRYKKRKEARQLLKGGPGHDPQHLHDYLRQRHDPHHEDGPDGSTITEPVLNPEQYDLNVDVDAVSVLDVLAERGRVLSTMIAASHARRFQARQGGGHGPVGTDAVKRAYENMEPGRLDSLMTILTDLSRALHSADGVIGRMIEFMDHHGHGLGSDFDPRMLEHLHEIVSEL